MRKIIIDADDTGTVYAIYVFHLRGVRHYSRPTNTSMIRLRKYINSSKRNYEENVLTLVSGSHRLQYRTK